jgi:DMSO/TMAO reductase YedYZ molybdopterin-dependent catalytic subunit
VWLGPGLAASLALTGLTLALRVIAGVPSPPELAEDWVLGLIPGELFSLALERLGYAGKPLLLIALVGVQLIAGILLFGVVGSRLYPRTPAWSASRRRAVQLIISGVGGLVSLAALGELVRAGLEPTGSATAKPSVRPQAGELDLDVAAPDPAPATAAAPPPAAPALSLPPGVSPAITPTRSFYIVSKNFVDPVVQAEGWSLEITGLIERPLTLSYVELLGLPAVEVERTLECISNPIGGPEISNAVWRGVPLLDLFDRVSVLPEATEAVFTSADKYLEHLPLEHLRQGSTLLVHTINGEPLPPRHGFPVRLLTTGLYGMKNPKWLRSIELTNRVERGYWERRGWTATAPIRTTARIDVPRVNQRVSQPELDVGGIAFAGERGIQRVEVSLDEGQTWTPAEHEPDRLPSTWTRWGARLALPDRSPRQLMVRATDGHGELQDSAVRRTFPSGGSGYHRVLVEWADEPT